LHENILKVESVKIPEGIKKQKTCGIVMPISPIDGMPASHWEDVKNLLIEVASSQGFETNLVSTATVSGLLPERIVTNLYQNDIVICDVSGRNPNVMFELGLRLAFDKPTIIIKDDATEYVFDIQSIGHLDYPRSLRITKMEVFKKELEKSLNYTYAEKIRDPEYSTFLKHYKIFEAKKIETTSDFQGYMDGKIDQLVYQIATINQLSQRQLSLLNQTTYQKMQEDEERIQTETVNRTVENAINKFLKLRSVSAKDCMADTNLQEELLAFVNDQVNPGIVVGIVAITNFLQKMIY
jgi:hypothetical protein